MSDYVSAAAQSLDSGTCKTFEPWRMDVVRDVIYSEVTGLVQQVLKIFGFISLKEAGQTHERAVQGGPRANLSGEVREQVPNVHGFFSGSLRTSEQASHARPKSRRQRCSPGRHHPQLFDVNLESVRSI